MEIQTSSTVILDQGQTDTRTALPGTLLRLNAAIWLAGLAISLIVTIPTVLRYEKSTALTALDGKLALDFEHFITREHPYRSASLNSWSAMELSLFRAGKPGLVIGHQDWLFSAEEFPLPSLRERNLRDNVTQMRAIVDTLERKGIRTIILPVPAKAEVYGEHVPVALRSHVMQMDMVSRELDAQKLPWIPILEPLTAARLRGEETFFRTETHWTPEGAKVAASAVAGWLDVHSPEQWPRQDFQVYAGPRRALESDLESYLPLRPHFSELLPPGETYMPYKFTRKEIASDESALFSDTANAVAIVGTSYSADDRWNFPGWLRVELGTDIDNISEKGKGPFDPMARFLKMVEDGKSGAKVVIWEMPVRSLAMDFSPEKKRGNY